MKKRIFTLILCICVALITGCSQATQESYFEIRFFDVGHGDSALVECDGKYMLIDGGDKTAADKLYDVFAKDLQINHLDVLVLSHLHEDHVAGLVRVLDYVQSIGLTLSNSADSDSDFFIALSHSLSQIGSEVEVPSADYEFYLGSAKVEVISARAEKDNDSLVLLITYDGTKFLFTGDMNQNQEREICEQYGDDNTWDIDVLKVAHHGSDTSTSYRFLRMLNPKNAIISSGNKYQLPSSNTLKDLEKADVTVYRTDEHGDIRVISKDGELLFLDSLGEEILLNSSK